MAKGVELAVGYVSLVAETRDLQKGVTRALNAAGDNAGATGRRMGREMGQGASSSFGDVMKKGLATAGIAGGLASITAGFTAAIQSGTDFQRNLNTLKGASNASAAEMAQISARARELGRDVNLTGTSAQDAAAAMTELVKGGLDVQQAMDAARGTLQLATAAQVEAATAAEIQARTLNTFGLGAESAAMVADALSNAANAASGEITDVAYAMQAGGAVASNFGLSVEDTVTALALFAKNGIIGSDAGTMLKASLLAITDSSNPAQGAIEELGLTLYDQQGRFVGIRSMMDQLNQAAKRMTPEMYQAATNTLFGSDAARIAGIAARTTGADFDEMSKAVTNQGGAARLAAAQTEGLPGVFERLSNTLDEAKLQVSDLVDGPLMEVGNWVNTTLGDLLDALKGDSSSGAFSDLVKEVKQAWPDIQKFGIALGKIVETLGGTAWSLFTTALGLAGDAAGVLAPLLGVIASALDGQEGLVTGIAVAWAAWKFIPGLLDRMPGPLGNIRQTLPGVVSGMRGFREEMALQRSLAQAQGIQLGGINAALATMQARYPALSRMGEAYRAGVDSADRFGRTAGIARAGVSGLGTAAGGLMSMLGGPWGIALGGASIALGYLAQKHQEAADKAAQQRQEEEALRATLDKSTGRITEQTREQVATKFQEINTDQRAKSYGIDPTQLIDAALGTGDPNAYNDIRKRAADIVNQQVDDKGLRTRNAMIDIRNAGITNEELTQALLREGNAWEDVNKKLSNYQSNQKSINKDYQKGVEGLQGFIDIMPDVRESFITMTQNINEQRNTVGDMSQKQRELQAMLEGTWRATEEGVKRFKDLGASIVQVPDSKSVVVTALTEDAQNKLKGLGYQVEAMKDGNFKVVAETDDAKRRIAELIEKINQPHKMTIEAQMTGVAAILGPMGPTAAALSQLPKKKDGGAVYGPGSGKSDDVLMWGSAGEHMLTADDVDNMGGHRGVFQLRRAAAQGMLPGFKDGGPVDLEDLFGGDLGPGLADETGLQSKTILINRAISMLFGDRIQKIGGMRADALPYHPSGRALDIMIPNSNTPEGKKLGDDIRRHLLENASAYGLEDVIWQQNWTGANGQSNRMDDRGNPTANHMDHVHATSIGGGKPKKNTRFVLPAAVRRQLTEQYMANGGAGPADAAGLMAQIMGNGGIPTGREGGSGVGRLASGGISDDGPDRTEGYIPAAAGSTGQAGTSFAAGLLNMGAEAINGLIDQAASAAATAASAAATVGSFGAGGQAAGPAAAAAIGLGANAAKRGVSWGFQMAGIGVDALVEQLFPFGAPRWLGYDYTGFVPQLQNQGAATTTMEKAEAQKSAVDPNTTEHGEGSGAAPGPELPGAPVQAGQMPGSGAPGTQMPPQPGALPGVGGGQGPLPPPPPGSNPFGTKSGPGPATPPPIMDAPPAAAQQQSVSSPMGPEWLKMMGIFDSGGMLPPGGMAINLSKSPEPVLTGRQWADVSTAAARQPLDPGALQGNDYSIKVDSINVKDVDELMGQLNDKQRLQMMRYAGRP